jgi:hypothetical protein
MSTTNKILQTIRVAAVCDVMGAGVMGLAKNDFDVNEFTKDFGIKAFTEGFVINLFISTIPALGAIGIDKFVNQNITSNKTIQYGLTAAEGVLVFPTVFSVCTQKNEFTEFFKKLSSPSFKGQAGMIKVIVVNSMIQSLAFKYIWDSSDEATPEIDQKDDLDLNLDALNISTDFGSL